MHSKPFEDTILAELPYWPSVSYLAKITIHKRLLLEKCEHFVKSSNRNRCFISSANGIQLLTIPIAGGRSHKQPYAETLIDHRLPWQRQHWHAIESAYGKSAFFEYYHPELKPLYEQSTEKLWEFNEQLLRWLLKKLQIEVEVDYSKSYVKSIPGLDARTSKGPHQNELPPYYQVFANKNGFLSDMAGMDLLFNLGPRAAKAYLLALKQAGMAKID
jgi:hypothetical protein